MLGEFDMNIQRQLLKQTGQSALTLSPGGIVEARRHQQFGVWITDKASFDTLVFSTTPGCRNDPAADCRTVPDETATTAQTGYMA